MYIINKFKNNKKNRGIIIIVVIIILTFLMGTGLIFYRSSMQSTSNIYYRSDFLKARNLARGSFEKALAWVYDHYEKGGRGDTVSIKGNQTDFLSGEMESGKYGVTSIELVNKLNVNNKTIINQKYLNRPYVIEDRYMGCYDLIKIETYGEVKDIIVHQSSTVKILIGEVSY